MTRPIKPAAASPCAPVAPDPSSEASRVTREVLAGDSLGLSGVAAIFPPSRSGAKGMSPSATFRWAKDGSKAVDGRLVKLETCRVGNRLLTSRAAVERFILALSTPAAAPAAPEKPAPEARKERAARAAKKLQAIGA